MCIDATNWQTSQVKHTFYEIWGKKHTWINGMFSVVFCLLNWILTINVRNHNALKHCNYQDRQARRKCIHNRQKIYPTLCAQSKRNSYSFLIQSTLNKVYHQQNHYFIPHYFASPQNTWRKGILLIIVKDQYPHMVCPIINA